MGCTNGKSAECNKEISMTVNNLITSYSSIEFYIQTQRVQTYESLLKDMDDMEKEEVALQEGEVNEMDNIHKDLAIFKRFKVINKYKHELVVSKFLKSIKQCMLKLQSINEINSKYLSQLNELKNTPNMKISKKLEEKIKRLYQLIMKITFYMEVEQNANTNVSLNHMLELNSTFNKRLSMQKHSQYNSEKEFEEVF